MCQICESLSDSTSGRKEEARNRCSDLWLVCFSRCRAVTCEISHVPVSPDSRLKKGYAGIKQQNYKAGHYFESGMGLIQCWPLMPPCLAYPVFSTLDVQKCSEDQFLPATFFTGKMQQLLTPVFCSFKATTFNTS